MTVGFCLSSINQLSIIQENPPLKSSPELLPPIHFIHIFNIDEDKLPSQILLPNTIHPFITYSLHQNQFPFNSTTYQPSTYFQSEHHNNMYASEESQISHTDWLSQMNENYGHAATPVKHTKHPYIKKASLKNRDGTTKPAPKP